MKLSLWVSHTTCKSPFTVSTAPEFCFCFDSSFRLGSHFRYYFPNVLSHLLSIHSLSPLHSFPSPSARESHLGPGLLPPTCHAAPPNSPLRCLPLQCQSERPETQIGLYFKPFLSPGLSVTLPSPPPWLHLLWYLPQLGTECPAQADTLLPLCLVVGPPCGLWGIEWHPWPPPVRCQEHLHSIHGN